MQEGAGQGPDWSWGTCHIPRGDLQTTFLFKGFDEARRLGLNRDTEARVRAALAADTAGVSAPGESCCTVLPCTADFQQTMCLDSHLHSKLPVVVQLGVLATMLLPFGAELSWYLLMLVSSFCSAVMPLLL